MKRAPSNVKGQQLLAVLPRLLGSLVVCIASIQGAHADETVISGNVGVITANAELNFVIAISKFVMLRVGAADATQSDVTFAVGIPTLTGAPGNSMVYTGAIPPMLATAVASTYPTTAAGALTVAAWTNITGTTLTCTVATLGSAIPFAAGATTAGVPGRADIKVASTAGGVQHPGADLSACNGSVSTPIQSLTTLNGIFTYSTAFTASDLLPGNYGNQVIYTATTL